MTNRFSTLIDSQSLSLTEHAAPAGGHYHQAAIGTLSVGTISKTPGGYLAAGHRKPSATLKGAAEKLLESRLRRLEAERLAVTTALATLRQPQQAIVDTQAIELAIGDVVEYRRPGVGRYHAKVTAIDLDRGVSAFQLQPLCVPSRPQHPIVVRPFWASHRNIRRVVALAANREAASTAPLLALAGE